MIDDKRNTQISKFLSLVLRHAPEKIGLELDNAGWTSMDQLILKMEKHGQKVDRAILEYVVATNSKKRFAVSEDGMMIRANQGHSIKVEHGYESIVPPEILYHGTADRNENSISAKGLDKRQRHHVHLSADIETAVIVGKRHGKAIVFEVNAGKMHRNGLSFYTSENGVWLTDEVPPQYLSKKKQDQ